jgi:hypothetical protein
MIEPPKSRDCAPSGFLQDWMMEGRDKIDLTVADRRGVGGGPPLRATHPRGFLQDVLMAGRDRVYFRFPRVTAPAPPPTPVFSSFETRSKTTTKTLYDYAFSGGFSLMNAGPPWPYLHQLADESYIYRNAMGPFTATVSYTQGAFQAAGAHAGTWEYTMNVSSPGATTILVDGAADGALVYFAPLYGVVPPSPLPPSVGVVGTYAVDTSDFDGSPEGPGITGGPVNFNMVINVISRTAFQAPFSNDTSYAGWLSYFQSSSSPPYGNAPINWGSLSYDGTPAVITRLIPGGSVEANFTMAATKMWFRTTAAGLIVGHNYRITLYHDSRDVGGSFSNVTSTTRDFTATATTQVFDWLDAGWPALFASGYVQMIPVKETQVRLTIADIT